MTRPPTYFYDAGKLWMRGRSCHGAELQVPISREFLEALREWFGTQVAAAFLTGDKGYQDDAFDLWMETATALDALALAEMRGAV